MPSRVRVFMFPFPLRQFTQNDSMITGGKELLFSPNTHEYDLTDVYCSLEILGTWGISVALRILEGQSDLSKHRKKEVAVIAIEIRRKKFITT
mmetsp:Transcript_28989/g.39436  ORF Transcript_28989/g.39436 Transcript_28989/m.39436 type:complete len:93 (+) Transcript_28989:176-454(+)